MASGTVQAPHLNGGGLPSRIQENTAEAEFYRTLFRLQEEVLSGRHPRIRLPASVLENVASRGLSHAHSSPSRPTTNGAPAGDVQDRITAAFNDLPSKSVTSSAISAPSSGQRPFPLKPSASIDPVLLTKSDDLIRAELQLKRQRIERELKDQYDAKKVQSRDKDFGLDAESRLDVSEIFARALEIVKPVSGLTASANQNSSASESFDENSYYSSQANSWSSEAEQAEGVQAAAAGKGKEPVYEVDSAAGPPHGHAQDGEADDADYEPAADIQMVDQSPYRAAADLTEREDSDYSPPPADASAGQGRADGRKRDGHGHHSVGATNPSRARALNGITQRQVDTRAHSPPAQDVPVIRNHIRSPVAPQPSRVSPLAVAKKPRQVDRLRGNGQMPQAYASTSSPKQQNGRPYDEAGPSNSRRTSPQAQAQQSPNGPRQNLQNPRKRRREADPSDKRRSSGKRVARTPPAHSPEPYIKPEPVSPPAALGTPQDQPRGRRAMYPLVDEMEIVSPRDGRPRPVYYQPQRIYDDEPLSPTVMRGPSRGAYRVLQRDDLDLRRVASIQSARRPYSPGAQPTVYQDGRTVRAASHAAFIDPPHPPAVYRSASIRPDHYAQVRPRSPITYIDDGYASSRTPFTMAPPPPPRPIYVDDLGYQYYATPPEPPLPLPRVRRLESSEVMYERSISRAPPRETIIYEDDDAAAGMRPPPPHTRRYLEPADYGYVEHPPPQQPQQPQPQPQPYRPEQPQHQPQQQQRAYSMRPSDPSLPPLPQQQLQQQSVMYAGAPSERRHAVIYEDVAPPGPAREYAGARAYSVRPEAIRREQLPVEYVARHESVQPGYVRRVEPLQGHGQGPVYMAEQQARHGRYVEEEQQLGQEGEGGRRGYRY